MLSHHLVLLHAIRQEQGGALQTDKSDNESLALILDTFEFHNLLIGINYGQKDVPLLSTTRSRSNIH